MYNIEQEYRDPHHPYIVYMPDMQQPQVAPQMTYPQFAQPAAMPMAPMQPMMAPPASVVSPPMPSGSQMLPMAGAMAPGGGAEESYIENILRFNRGKMATFYMTFENNNQWNARVFRGRVETAGRDHIIISDPQTGKRYILLMVNLDWVEFDGPVAYIPPTTPPGVATELTTGVGPEMPRDGE